MFFFRQVKGCRENSAAFFCLLGWIHREIQLESKVD